MKLFKLQLAALGFSLTLLASGCATYKDADAALQLTQLPELPASFPEVENFSPAVPVSAWWEQLQDAPLNALIDRALEQNHDIRAAGANLDASRALLRNSRQGRVPTVDVVADGARQNQASNPLAGDEDLITESYQGAVELSWEADLFGRIGNEVQVAAAQARIAADDLHAAQVSIAAEVASAYIALRGAQYQLQVAEENATNQQETYDLTLRLADIGRGDQFDVTRALAQLEQTRAGIPALEADIDVALNRLAVLSNRPLDELQVELAQLQPLPSVPGTVAIGSPVDLLQRRPDIRRAEHALQGAVAGYNVRVADLYPRITFSGGLGYLSSDWGSLGEQSGNFFAFAPTIRWAGLNTGRVLSQIDAADARIDARVADFERSVLLALEETDNALRNFSHEEQRRLHLLAAAEASEQAADFARQRFEIGSSDFLGVLSAERSRLELNASLAQSETQLLLNLVGVYKALGGAWGQ